MSRSRFRVNVPNVLNETIDGETIIINAMSGNYYSLNATGSDIWNAIERTAEIDQIVDLLARRYDGRREEMKRGVMELVDELEREELIVPYEENGQEVQVDLADDAPSGASFAAPKLDKYTDMQDLILLDPVHEVSESGWPHAGRGAV